MEMIEYSNAVVGSGIWKSVDHIDDLGLQTNIFSLRLDGSLARLEIESFSNIVSNESLFKRMFSDKGVPLVCHSLIA